MLSFVTFATNDHPTQNYNSGVNRSTDFISIDALILHALVQCQGTGREKAEVFVRVISPEMQENILVDDEDLRIAVSFMISSATIFEEMTREM